MSQGYGGGIKVKELAIFFFSSEKNTKSPEGLQFVKPTSRTGRDGAYFGRDLFVQAGKPLVPYIDPESIL